MTNLDTFNKKIALFENVKASNPGLASLHEIEPKFTKLQTKVISRLRQFVLGSISGCKRIDMLQESHRLLIQYSYFYQFLFKYAPGICLVWVSVINVDNGN